MSKIGTIGGIALATTLLAVVHYHPSHASNALLAKAQSEFVTKARTAVLERRIGEASTNVAVATPLPASPAGTYVVASLEPVAPPSTVQLETSAATVVPVSTTAKEPVETPVANELPEPAKIEVVSVAKEIEVKPEVTAQPAELTVEQIIAALKGREVAAPQTVAPAPQAVAPVTEPVAQQPVMVVAKTTQAPDKKTTVAARRAERGISKEYNIEALRARAPKIAAMIARYM